MLGLEGKQIILSGWKKSDIFDAIPLGSTALPPSDTLADLCSFVEIAGLKEGLNLTSIFPEELLRQ